MPILKAEPVIKAQIEARGMNSTIQPSRARPKKVTIAPAIIAIELAIDAALGLSLGCASWVELMTLPTMVDMTATG